MSAFTLRTWLSRLLLLLFVLPLTGATCSDGAVGLSATTSDDRLPSPSPGIGDQSPSNAPGRAPTVAEGSGSSAPIVESGQASDDPFDSSTAVETEQETPPDIFAVMLGAGFTLETEQDLADFLPIPPRADGQVGRFLIGSDTVVVARVTYPEVVFADPHEQWIRERMALLPEAHERVVRKGATVIHIRADTDQRADEVRDLFLGLDAPDSPMEGGS